MDDDGFVTLSPSQKQFLSIYGYIRLNEWRYRVASYDQVNGKPLEKSCFQWVWVGPPPYNTRVPVERKWPEPQIAPIKTPDHTYTPMGYDYTQATLDRHKQSQPLQATELEDNEFTEAPGNDKKLEWQWYDTLCMDDLDGEWRSWDPWNAHEQAMEKRVDETLDDIDKRLTSLLNPSTKEV